MAGCELRHKHEAFVQRYCVHFNGALAARESGYSEDSAAAIGSQLLARPEIKARIEERKEELAVAAQLSPEWIVKKWIEIATADPADLTHTRRVNCRHCWGIDGRYQWTVAEYQTAVDKAILHGNPAPDGFGGFDFEPMNDPNINCQECGGEGEEYVHIADTRKVKGNARKLFAGVKQTKNGIEVLMRDQDAALANLAKYLGMSLERKEISGPNGKPIAVANITAEDLTDAQLAALITPETDVIEE